THPAGASPPYLLSGPIRRVFGGIDFAGQLIRMIRFDGEVAMTRKLIPLALGILMIASVALADTGERKDLQVFNDVSKAVTRYTKFTIFNSVHVVVKDVTVRLPGDVTM